jgi:hypothetical protein
MARYKTPVILMELSFLLNDNAHDHSTMIPKRILANGSMMHISCTPSSPDHAPSDFSVFPAVKPTFKARIFQDVDDHKKNLTAK